MRKSKTIYQVFCFLVMISFSACYPSNSSSEIPPSRTNPSQKPLTTQKPITSTHDPSDQTATVSARSTHFFTQRTITVKTAMSESATAWASAQPTTQPYPTFPPPPKTRPEYDSVSGRYQLGQLDYGSYCLLNVAMQPESYPQEIGIELGCDRGAPSMNSGYALDIIIIEDDTAVYSPWFNFGECYIVFKFINNQVKVVQIGSGLDCGFGHAVYADGIYDLIDPTPPKLGCMEYPFCENEVGQE
jgi:hypothetical protein